MNPTPIETKYLGYRFRSRLESRWAVAFRALGTEFVYEPEGFILPSAGKYLPDFFLQKHKTFAECKPITPTPSEQAKLSELCVTSGMSGVFLIGVPGEERVISSTGGSLSLNVCPCGELVFCRHHERQRVGTCPACNAERIFREPVFTRPALARAYSAGRPWLGPTRPPVPHGGNMGRWRRCQQKGICNEIYN